MANVLQRAELTLRSFYIFNSLFGKKDGEEAKKVLYYYPRDIELNTKIKDVGLSEAIIAFTGTFATDDDCKALHTQKTTQVFYQPESSYWMVLVINVPKEVRSKDGVEVADYRGCEVHDHIFRTVLEQCYNMFRLFFGTFQMNLEAGNAQGEEALKQLQLTLSSFFDKYLQSLKLSTCDVMDVMRSIQYLPLDKYLFLRAHNFINIIHANFPAIAETILLYNEQVVCSGKLDPIDLNSLHEYIVGTMMPNTTPSELGYTSGIMRSNSTISETYRNGAFITGPENCENATKLPKVYIGRKNALQAFLLVIYRILGATLCLFIEGREEPQNDFYTELQAYMSPQLATIARDIGDTFAKQTQLNATVSTVAVASNANTMTPKYLFINEQSLKHLSNISIDRRRPKIVHNIPMNVMNLIADMENDTDRNAYNSSSASSSFQEIQVKTTNDFWIVKRRCNWRQYYVIIFNSKATLLEITHEAKRIFEQELTDDVFFDK